jgi:cyclic pyranopterin phosphate synthase
MSVRQADISEKPVLFRLATAKGKIRLRQATVELIRSGKLEKGDALAISKVMAILTAKRAPEILALCHPLRIESTEVTAELEADSIDVTVTVTAHEKTGVEMEALAGVGAALLNIWDVTKAYEKDENGQYPVTRIEEIRVVEKVKRDDDGARVP